MPKTLPKVLSLDGHYVILNQETNHETPIVVKRGKWRIPFLSWHPISSIKVPYIVLEFETEKDA